MLLKQLPEGWVKARSCALCPRGNSAVGTLHFADPASEIALSRFRWGDMKSAVIVFPGINRERDMARTLRLVSGRDPVMVWHAETALPAGTDLVALPGGFS